MNKIIKSLILGLMVSFGLQTVSYFPLEWVLTLTVLIVILFFKSARLAIIISMFLLAFPIFYHSSELAILYFIFALSFVLIFYQSYRFFEIYFLIFSMPLLSIHNALGFFIPLEFIIVPLAPLLLGRENVLIVILSYLFYSIIKIISLEGSIGYILVDLPDFSFYSLVSYPALFYDLSWVADKFYPFINLIRLKIILLNIGKVFLNNSTLILQMAFWGAIAYLIKYFQRLKKQRSSLWFDRVQKYKNQLQSLAESSSSGGYINPQKLLVELRKILPEDTIVTTEVGQNQMWAALHFKALKPRTFLSSGGLGTMGFGFPAALGAKVACPDRLVVDIAGDGSFIMTSQDLACSVMEKIPVIVIVLNNSMLGMVAQWQRFFYNRKYCAVELGNSPDFVKLAEAYGAQGFRVSSLNEFSKAVRKAMKSDITTVIDVPISPEENVFPMIPPGKGLKDMITE